ncbi:ImmA/IrrE family metallo-endopeptidase [Populibacterium corticicola]|uniref:ImmA/IrrE family metallo-endopeptidase n=1 Tax=Populibacterium corticicola TaxID=1812826 RepID=A0ABW5XDI3_9MICO
MDRLLALAHNEDVRVVWRNLGKRRGEYVHGARLIRLNPRMSEVLQRSTLAHELGHAHHGDAWTDNPHIKQLREERANLYAARLLISPLEYAVAEQLVGHHTGALAKELGVASYIIDAWKTAPPTPYLQLIGRQEAI